MRLILVSAVFCFTCMVSSGCVSHDDGYYERANHASEQAQERFDKE
jgi:hypothetical protein